MSTNINFNKKLGITGGTSISSSSSSTPSYQNEYSFQFDGNIDYIDTNSIYRELDGEKIVTFSIWVKPTSIVQQIFLGLQHSTSTMSHLILYSSNILRMTFADGGYYMNSNSGVITAGQWNHIMVCFDKNQTSSSLRGKIFVNGQDETSGVNLNNVAYPTATTPLRIGAYPTGSNNANGLIDEVAIWVGTDLRDDVSTIYNGGVPNNLNDNGLIAPTTWFRMGEEATYAGGEWTLVDQGSGGNDGFSDTLPLEALSTDVPSPSFSTNSFTFDGNSDYIDMGNTLDFTNTDAFSISCWFKRTRNGVSEFLVAKQDSTSNFRGYTLLIPFSDNKVTVVIRNNTASSGRLIVDCATAITDTNWHHIVMTYDGSSSVGGINLYLDGNNDTGVTSGTLSATISNSASFQIGARNGGNEFSGNIDEVAIFNSELSGGFAGSDVTTIYNNGVPNDLSSFNPISWWRMGEVANYAGGEWVLTDQGSGGNNGFSSTIPAPPAQPSTDVPS